MTPRRIFQVPAPKKCAESYRGLNPRGRGPGGFIGFVFRMCLSFQKIKNFKKFLVIIHVSVILFRLSFLYGCQIFRVAPLFCPPPGPIFKNGQV